MVHVALDLIGGLKCESDNSGTEINLGMRDGLILHQRSLLINLQELNVVLASTEEYQGTYSSCMDDIDANTCGFRNEADFE